MAKKKQVSDVTNDPRVDESALFRRVSAIIENRKSRAGAYVNSEATLMYWEVGRHIGAVLLGGERAEYGKRIVSALSTQLVAKYGRTFELPNIRRMIRFAENFSDIEIVTPLASQLSWSHIIELLPLKTDEARMYYANDSMARNYSAKRGNASDAARRSAAAMFASRLIIFLNRKMMTRSGK